MVAVEEHGFFRGNRPEEIGMSAAEKIVPDDEDTPLLLRRARRRPEVSEVTANMTVVTTQGNQPEMHDQTDDPTASRKD